MDDGDVVRIRGTARYLRDAATVAGIDQIAIHPRASGLGDHRGHPASYALTPA